MSEQRARRLSSGAFSTERGSFWAAGKVVDPRAHVIAATPLPRCRRRGAILGTRTRPNPKDASASSDGPIPSLTGRISNTVGARDHPDVRDRIDLREHGALQIICRPNHGEKDIRGCPRARGSRSRPGAHFGLMTHACPAAYRTLWQSLDLRPVVRRDPAVGGSIGFQLPLGGPAQLAQGEVLQARGNGEPGNQAFELP